METPDAEAAAEDLSAFCQQLIDLAQFKACRDVKTGSRAEISYQDSIMPEFGLDNRQIDLDRMHYRTHRYAFPRKLCVPDIYRGSVIRVFTDHMHPGYARLWRETDDVALQHEDLRSKYIDNGQVIHGPALQKDLYKSLLASSKDKAVLEGKVIFEDFVPAVHCPYWPAEASEWIRRTRLHPCPSRSVVKRVVRYGCDFVGVAHKLSRNRDSNNEWRFSFSKAELIIIRSWTRAQRVAHRSIKLINNIIQQETRERGEDAFLCTYYFKTLMLWACEEQPPEFWTDSSLVNTVRLLLVEMCEWLTAKHCPNYFIPGNNMMDYLAETDVSRDVTALLKYSTNADFLTSVIAACHDAEDLCVNTTEHADIPAWIHRSLVIYTRIFNRDDFHIDLFSTNHSVDLKEVLHEEFCDIFEALRCHVAATGDSARDRPEIAPEMKKNYQREAEMRLQDATSLFQSTISRLFSLENINDELITTLYRPYDPEPDSLTGLVVQKQGSAYNSTVGRIRLPNESFGLPVSVTKKDRDRLRSWQFQSPQVWCKTSNFTETTIESVSITRRRVMQMRGKSLSDKFHYRYWPGRSPTVNVSWFIAKAYLANLYYTTRRDYGATVQTCDDIIECLKQSDTNRAFADLGLLFLVSTKWANIYDEEIREILGFHALCSYVLRKKKMSSAQFGICPVLFAYYLKRRCTVDQFDKSEIELMIQLDEGNAGFESHLRSCHADPAGGCGRLPPMLGVAMNNHAWKRALELLAEDAKCEYRRI